MGTWRRMVVITTGKMEVAIVIAAMAAQHPRLKGHLADRCIFRIVHRHALAGAAPVRAGQAGYGRHLDRDGDGIGCE